MSGKKVKRKARTKNKNFLGRKVKRKKMKREKECWLYTVQNITLRIRGIQILES